MRKWLKMLLLAGMFTVLLCGSALAAGEKGIGDVSSGDKFTVQTANGTPVQTVPTNQLPDGMKSNFYPNAERIAINCKYTGMPAGEEVIVFVLTEKGTPTADNIVYIDQATATDTGAAFNIYPKSLTGGTTYYVYMAAASKSLTQYGSFKYYAAFKLGDPSGEGNIDTGDALMVLRDYANIYKLSGNAFSAADVVTDGRLDTQDALAILRYYARIITSFT